jgi:protein LTV1
MCSEDLTQFGIYYSDQDSYDYSKHLKPIGEDPNAVFMATKQTKSKKTVSFDLPEDVFASKEEYAVGLMNQQNDNGKWTIP